MLGRNGAGKSTLLKTIVGIAPPATGSSGSRARARAAAVRAEIARLGIGYVPQGRGLFAGMSVPKIWSSVACGGKPARRALGARKIFDYFPAHQGALATRPADYLSGGEQQMVAVARALSGDTRVLLLDEPFEGLGARRDRGVVRGFDKLRQEIAIVIVDHHLDLALALSDRTVALERGQVIHRASKALRDDLDLRRKVLWL